MEDVRELRDAETSPRYSIATKQPGVFRGLALDWPAVHKWSIPFIGTLAPDMPVQIVLGNRERDSTRFTQSTLGHYVDLIDSGEGADLPYLKEFDLLKKFPELKCDLRQGRIVPPDSISSSSVWIGPTGAHTGLHYDILDNFATVISGRKRFMLARPGVVERLNFLSRKYDEWAILSSAPFSDFIGDYRVSVEEICFVDLEPGDVLYVPAGWWHEVLNLSPSILLSGFFGDRRTVVEKWARVKMRSTLHCIGFKRRFGCTCHHDGSMVSGGAS